jgi:hypothetical protein
MKNLDQIIKKEGDFYKWTYTSSNGLDVDCFLRRNPTTLTLCGYVILTSDNKLYRLDYDEIYTKMLISVHGGLTYSDEGEDGWVIGFDCAHAGDLCPAFAYIDGIYRTKEFVISECHKLAEEVSKFSGIIKRLQNIDSILGKD